MKNYKIVFVILFIGITSRLVFSVFFSPIPSSGNTGDAVHYYESAVSLAEGKGYSFNGKPTANFPPGYSLILAGLFKLFFPSYKLAQFSNVIFGTISCLLTYAICKKAFGERAAMLALGIMALSPTNIVWSAVVFSENLFLPLLLGVILLWLHIIQDERPLRENLFKLILSGILLGLTSLTRGQAILLPAALFLWIIFNRKSFSSALIAALIVSLSMIFTVLPWTMRNKEIFGTYKLISTNGGINLLIGNHHGATGAYHDPEDGYPGGDDEVLKDRLCKEMAMSYIFSNPINFIKLIPKKIFFLWGADSTFTFRYELLAKLPHTIGYFLLASAHILYYLLFFAASAAIIMLMSMNFNNGIASPSARNDTACKGVIARGEAPKQSNSKTICNRDDFKPVPERLYQGMADLPVLLCD
ncbi:MAG: glycosyltransferase family 39 protein [Nitrospinae bacterium]|nr:glycosyltransferase family 39 protein [Nitrospinota bacterium]